MRLMKRVARRVALSLSESKRLTVANQTVFNNAGSSSQRWMFKNVFAQLTVASGSIAGQSWALEGSEVVDLMVKAKINFRMDWGALLAAQSSNGYGTIFLHVYLVSANDYTGSSLSGAPPPGTIAWSSYPTAFTADDPGWFLIQNGQNPTLNGNNIKIVRAWRKRYTPDILGQHISTADNVKVGYGVSWQTLNVKHKFRGKKTFEDNPNGDLDSNFLRSGVLRGNNYYWLVGWGSSSSIGLGALQPQVYMDEFLYFKDP